MPTCSTGLLRTVSIQIMSLAFLFWAGCTSATDAPEITLQRARMHSERREFAEAVPLYTRAMEEFPERPEVVYLRGVAYENLNLPERALEDYAKCIELDSRHADAINNYGVVLARLNRQSEAVEQFSRLISMNPEDVLALRNRGLCYHDLGQTQKSIDDYSRAIEVAPTDPEAWFQRGNVNLDAGNYAAAVGDFSQAIEIDEFIAKAWMNRGIAQLHLGRRDEAQADLRKGQELDREIIFPGLDLLEQAPSVAESQSWQTFVRVAETRLTEGGYQDLQLISEDPYPGFAFYRGLRETNRVDILVVQDRSQAGDSQERHVLVPHEFLEAAAANDGTRRSRTLMIMKESTADAKSWEVVEMISDWQPDENKIQSYIDRIAL